MPSIHPPFTIIVAKQSNNIEINQVCRYLYRKKCEELLLSAKNGSASEYKLG